MRTKWTWREFYDYIAWHESVIAKYPYRIVEELREARETFMRGIKVGP